MALVALSESVWFEVHSYVYEERHDSEPGLIEFLKEHSEHTLKLRNEYGATDTLQPQNTSRGDKDDLRIYLASSWRNEYQPGIVKRLRAMGHVVYDFKEAGDGWGETKTGDTSGPVGFGWSEVDPNWMKWPSRVDLYLKGLHHPRAVEGFNRDMDALKSCDLCLMVQPCGSSASMEMGYAVGAGKKVVVYIPAMREPELMVKMADMICLTFQDVVTYLSTPVCDSKYFCFTCCREMGHEGSHSHPRTALIGLSHEFVEWE